MRSLRPRHGTVTRALVRSLMRVVVTIAAAIWPLAPVPEVWQTFSPPAERWSSGHRGADLLGSVGQPVHAVLDGTVAFAGTIAGVPSVSLDHHDGTRTTYQPVLGVVTPGQEIAAGTVLGALVPVGSHCAPATCLHWGLRRGRDYLDPLSLVARAHVRLLPLN